MNLSQCVNWRSRNDVMGHFRPIDNVYAMSAYPPTAVELSQRSEPPLRAKSDRCTVANNVVIRSRRRRGPDRARARQTVTHTERPPRGVFSEIRSSVVIRRLREKQSGSSSRDKQRSRGRRSQRSASSMSTAAEWQLRLQVRCCLYIRYNSQ